MKRSIGKIIGERLNEFADALEKGDKVSAKFTSRKVVLNLPSTTFDAVRVKSTRGMLKASQAIFAKFLGVSVDTVQSWEAGVNAPSPLAARFMDEIRANPRYWRDRFGQLVSRKTEA